MVESASKTFTPNPIDIHVGGRIRMRRKFLGLSQEGLAEHLGLTFQQVQKYERGSNRISASKIYQAARALKVPVPYFFEGLHEGEDTPTGEGISSSEAAVHAFLNTGEGIELAEAFPRITSARQRRKVLDLVKSLSDD